MKNKIPYILHFLFILLVMLGVSHYAVSQNFMATGKIVDKNEEPMIGANIRVQGTNAGTVTDMNVEFNLSCSPDNVL